MTPIRNGLKAFEEVCQSEDFNPMPLIVKTARWVDPITYQKLPIWYPETARRKPLYHIDWETHSTNKGVDKTESNESVNKALWKALGLKKSKHWTVCHIWGIDDPKFLKTNDIVQNHKYYSNVANMVLLPSPLKAFTDCVPEIKTMLRVCAYHLYGFLCEEPATQKQADEIRQGFIPLNYPEEWPRHAKDKHPPGVSYYKNNPKIQTSIDNRKTRIKRDLNNPTLNGTQYPKGEIIKTLKAFPSTDGQWWK